MIPRSALLLLTVFWTNCTQAPLRWSWQYTAPGINASGMVTVDPQPGPNGLRRIVAITGSRNGDPITALYPAGSSIPGNEPYKVDNLVALDPLAHLTNDGFGYATRAGHYATAFRTKTGYVEVFSAPPFTSGSGNLGPEDSEKPIVLRIHP
jgi:hypothetical protein